jgi:hypothetical protein
VKVTGPWAAEGLKGLVAKIDPALSFYLQSETQDGNPHQWTVQGILSYPKTTQTLHRAYQVVNGKWEPTTAPCWHVIEQIVKTIVLNGGAVWVHKVGFTKFTATAKLQALKAGLQAKGIACQCGGLPSIAPPVKPSKGHGHVTFNPGPIVSLSGGGGGGKSASAPAPVVTEPPKPKFDAPPLEGEPLTGTGTNADWAKIRDVEAAVTGMYLIEELSLTVPLEKLPPILQTRFAEMRGTYAATMARNLFDYLAIACMGEARHFHTQSAIPKGRHIAYQFALEHDPRVFLPVLVNVFCKGKWGSSYGGPKWGNIAKAASLYFKMAGKPLMFADHCVDLAHNGGLAFNKGIILKNPPDQGHYFAMLNQKREGSLLEWKETLRVPASVAVFVEALRLIGVDVPMTCVLEAVPDSPPPAMKWGAKPFTMEATDYGMSTVSPAIPSNNHPGYAKAEWYVPRGKTPSK